MLGKHSGRHALRDALEELGFKVEGQTLNTAFKRFKEIADKKKTLTAMDLEALVTEELRGEDIAGYGLEWFEVEASSRRPPHARVGVELPDGTVAEGSFTGDGPIDAVLAAINAATGVEPTLRDFKIGAVTEGQDALGEVSMVVEVDGFSGRRAGGLDRRHRGGRARVRAGAVGRAGAGGAAGGRVGAAGYGTVGDSRGVVPPRYCRSLLRARSCGAASAVLIPVAWLRPGHATSSDAQRSVVASRTAPFTSTPRVLTWF